MTPPQLSHIVQKTIASRLWAPVLAFGLLLGLLLALIQYYSVAQSNQELLVALTQNIQQYVTHSAQAMHVLARTAAVKPVPEALSALKRMHQAPPGFAYVALLDARGVLVDHFPKRPMGLFYPANTWQPLDVPGCRIGQPRMLAATDTDIVEIACPTAGDCTLVGALNLEPLTHHLRAFSQAGDDHLFLADAQGRLLLRPVGQDYAAMREVESWPAFASARQEGTFVQLQWVEGQLHLVVAQALPQTGWVLLISRRLEAMLRPALAASVAYLASVALLYLMVTRAIRREMGRRVVAPLQQFAGAIRRSGRSAKGQEEQTADDLASSGQGREAFAELSLLVQAFAAMARQAQDRETALRESEARYRAIYENAIEGIFQISPQGAILHGNPALARMFGYESEQDIHASLDTIAQIYANPEDRPRVLQELHATGQITGYELAMRRKDGSPIWVMVNAVAVRDASGMFVGIEGMLADITARKHTEQALAASREFFQAVFEGMHDGLVVRDAATGRILDANRRACELFGYAHEEMLGLDVRTLSQGDLPFSQREADANLRRARESGPHSFEWRSRRRDGTLFWTEITLVFVSVAGEERHLISIRDISERKEIEVARHEAEARYFELVHNAPVGIFRTMLGGRMVTANAQSARMLGYESPEELLEQMTDISQTMYAHPADRARILAQLMQTGSAHNEELRFKRKDGSMFWGSLTARLVRDEHGVPQYIEGFYADITDRKAAEAAGESARVELEQLVAERTKELRQANARLLELDQLKTAFLSSASHELRTPLTSILGFAKLTGKLFKRHFLIPEHASIAERQHGERIAGNLDIIAKEGARLARLVNDLLDINAIESGMMAWRDAEVSLSEIVEEAMASAQGMLGPVRAVRLESQVATSLPTLWMDRDKLLQVLQNLLGNAVKFTSTGSIRLVASAVSNVEPDAGGQDWVRISIEDTGPGMPAHALEAIFEKFYQVVPEGRDEDKPRGTGLGLAICKEIVEHYGGRIWVESTYGIGSTFTVQLPAHGVAQVVAVSSAA